MKITLSDLPRIDSAIDEMAKARVGPGVSYRTALLVLAAENPELFQARARLRSKRTSEEFVPYVFTGSSMLARLSPYLRERHSDLNPRATYREALAICADGISLPRASDHAMQSALDLIDTEIAKMRLEDPNLSIADAWRSLSSKRPDLIKSYNAAAARKSKATAEAFPTRFQ